MVLIMVGRVLVLVLVLVVGIEVHCCRSCCGGLAVTLKLTVAPTAQGGAAAAGRGLARA